MARPPKTPKKPKDPAKPTRAKAARPDVPALDKNLADLLNPAIGQGTAGLGSQTGLQQPPDNSWDRRADFADAHRARKSTRQSLAERPQQGYVGKRPVDIDAELAKALGFDGGDPSKPVIGETTEIDEISAIAEPQREPRHRPAPQPLTLGGLASQHSLELLLREGRPEFRQTIWTPHRPPRPDKSEGGRRFVIKSDFEPKGDQPQAIAELVERVRRNDRNQVLLGVTGSGKTFTMAKVIEQTQRPALILAPNKTLAAQLYGEFKSFFPDNAVEYFVSYYDYYQPEAYIPQTDTYIEKDSAINEQIEKLRLSATSSLLSRRDVIVVASVSCIYGLGSPEDYFEMMAIVTVGNEMSLDDLLRKLVDMQYTRNDIDFERSNFRVRGDTVEVCPSYTEEAVRIEFFGDRVEQITRFEPLTGHKIESVNTFSIYPAKHWVMPYSKITRAFEAIKAEMKERVAWFESQNKLVEAQRIYSRTTYDLEMLKEMGFCGGIENYSRHLSARAPGERPFTLMDFFPKDYLLVIDESHVTVSQIGGMYAGDRSRKTTLVEHGFRLPSALDNRPLNAAEFDSLIGQCIYMSATPGPYELGRSAVVAEQIIRPTGLVDPPVIVKPLRGQID